MIEQEIQANVDREEGNKAMHALVVATQQELSKERDVRLVEAAELGRALQTLEGCLTQHLQDFKLSVDAERSNGIMMHDRLAENLTQMKAEVNAQETLRLQTTHEMHDKVKKLSGELEAVRRECVAADDEITALTMVMESSIAKEKVEREHVDNHINSQINNVKQELIEQRGAHDNECSRLKGFVKNLEEQLSTYVTHLAELRFNHEAEVNKRSIAHENLEQIHRELKGAVDAHDANHLEAFTGLKNMIEQEIKAREKDTSNTERTFSVVSARFGTESSTTSKSVCDLRDKLKRLSRELETEVQDRKVGDSTARALVVAMHQELVKEKDMFKSLVANW